MTHLIEDIPDNGGITFALKQGEEFGVRLPFGFGHGFIPQKAICPNSVTGVGVIGGIGVAENAFASRYNDYRYTSTRPVEGNAKGFSGAGNSMRHSDHWRCRWRGSGVPSCRRSMKMHQTGHWCHKTAAKPVSSTWCRLVQGQLATRHPAQ